MNFLAEVLSCAEKIELSTINQTVPKLKQAIENLTCEVVQFTKLLYKKYSDRPGQNKSYLVRALQIEEEMKTLQKSADSLIKKELPTAEVELEKHVMSLKEVDFMLKIVKVLCELNDNLEEFNFLLEAKKYIKCVKLIKELETMVRDIPEDESVDVLSELTLTILEKKNILMIHLSNVFKEHVIETQQGKNITLKIKRDLKLLEEALKALLYYNSITSCMSDFAKSLWNNYFIPIVDTTVEIDINDTDTFNILAITSIDTARKCSYEQVFHNLHILLEFLKSHFNLRVRDKLTTLQYIGRDIGDNVAELIIKHCLHDTIPSTAEELQQYKVVIEHTQKLETVFKNTGIFQHDITSPPTSILKFANNVDYLYISKKCSEYESTADWIMKKDLYDMTEVGLPYDPAKAAEFPIDELPRCSVSKSAVELMTFLEKVMQNAVTSSAVCADQLFSTVQNAIMKYGRFIPRYHSKLLQTIPQQVALFYSNCFYISYLILKWDQTYCIQLRSKLDPCNRCFSTDAHMLQQIAEDFFNHHVKGHINQIQEIMDGACLEGPLLETLNPKTERSLRQCLRQQELLKTVWHKVLPYTVYNKTLGTILESLCARIITRILSIEDISSTAAEQLVEVIKLVLNRAPKLFSNPIDVSLYVKSWFKLTELNYVLSASLVDIYERWADGKGPLAVQFTATELKTLIRALFQNTNHRAAVLSRILEL